MTAVLSATTTTPTGISISPPTPSRRSFRRSTSQQNLFIDTATTPKQPSITYEDRRYSNSLVSSAPSSPRLASHDLSSLPSFASTPASSVCLQDSFFTDKEDDLQFPTYTLNYEEDDLPTPGNCSPVSSVDSEDCPCLDHKLYQSIGDDLSIKDQPSRHVDYLSHNWREEDVWSSWRHIVGKRHTLENWERLENAAWRTWQKSRNNLPVVPPEKLNWMKEHDVTWLYGPLQTHDMKRFAETAPVSTSALSRNDSFVVKKSCLKKRSLSEAMLQKSLSTSTLVQQAVDSLVSQTPANSSMRPGTDRRRSSGYGRRMQFSGNISSNPPSALTLSSPPTSGSQSPSHQRHITFSEKVEQCIAINRDSEDVDSNVYYEEEDESEEEVLMMVSDNGKERRLSSRSGTPRPSFSSDEKARTIAMLAPTTLRGDTPEPDVLRPMLTKSSSQETLKPTRPSTSYQWDDADDAELSWQPASSTDAEFDNEDEEMQLKGLRRTPSGMFMPYDEDGEEYNSSGVLGRVIDTINTAKDIAHVVWNVGWRK